MSAPVAWSRRKPFAKQLPLEWPFSIRQKGHRAPFCFPVFDGNDAPLTFQAPLAPRRQFNTALRLKMMIIASEATVVNSDIFKLVSIVFSCM